jgi:hypothetical protein
MNPIKWLRKNNARIMAVVVVLLMIAFTGDQFLRQLGQRRSGGLRSTLAYIGNKKVTYSDLYAGRSELEVLRSLRANVLLANIPDMKAIVLGELLFSEQRASPEIISHIEKTIAENNYKISTRQISEIYKHPYGSDIYWLVLKAEAEQAGVKISREYAGSLLGRMIPRLFPETTYQEMVRSLMNQRGVPEDEMLETFSKLLAVLEYAKMITSNEDITISQAMHNADWENETINAEVVRCDSRVFAAGQSEPSEQESTDQFNKYKAVFPGSLTDSNSYGFGYKLPDRVQLEYVAVKRDDIASIITVPAQEEAEDYYQKHIKQFTTSVPSDPNDPNSEPIEQTKSYVEVAKVISDKLLTDRINTMAEKILQEARTQTEAAFENVDIQKLTDEQIKKSSGNYTTAAEQLSKKYKIKVYSGSTGLLSATDIRNDKTLGTLYLKSPGFSAVALPQVVFAVNPINSAELGPSDVAKPRIYENIGPIRDMMGKIMMIVRIIKAEKSAEPESLNQTYSIKTIDFEQDPNAGKKETFSVRNMVTDDLKKLAAMNTAKTYAMDIVKLAADKGWENAVDEANKLYGMQNKTTDTEPNTFRLQKMTDLTRISRKALETADVQSEGDPAHQSIINRDIAESLFREQLYSLVPADSNTAKTTPLVMEFKPYGSYYAVKSISVKRLNLEGYEQVKAGQFFKDNFIQSQDLSVVHFNPENILKRMNFRMVEKALIQTDVNEANVPAESKKNL